jgi:methylthioribose-1-phosphate isomerase
MKTKLFIVAVFALAMGVGSANAQIRHRALNQHQRIREGVKSGELTRPEAKNLREDHKDLHQDIKEARSDGKITREERKDIRKEENKDSRKIYRKKHNERERH